MWLSHLLTADKSASNSCLVPQKSHFLSDKLIDYILILYGSSFVNCKSLTLDPFSIYFWSSFSEAIEQWLTPAKIAALTENFMIFRIFNSSPQSLSSVQKESKPY